MFPSPLYGHFRFDKALPLEVLVSRLQKISSIYLENQPFSSYLTLHSGETFYGLTYEELISQFQSHEDQTKTISLSVSTPDKKVIRIHIRFDPIAQRSKSQYVIAAGDHETNLEIKALLTGGEISLPKKRKSYRLVRPQVTEEAEATDDSPPIISPSSLTHRRTTILLNDSFYFDNELSIYGLLALLDELSDRYMDYLSFHAQLETTDGDYHFDIQREELRYMFNQRRHTLLNLYFYNANREGHWIDIVLFFHPLWDGPNVEIEICAPGSTIDDISDLIQDAIAIPPPDPVEHLDQSFTFESSGFSIETFISLFSHISHHFVFRIPPVVSLTTRNQKAYTGLSLFQLERLYKEQAKNIAALKVEMVHHATGQLCKAEILFPENNAMATTQLIVLMGNENVQNQIMDLVKNRLPSN